jgi:hypothetical protein
MNLLKENTKLNINMIKIIDSYINISGEFLFKIERECFKKITTYPIIVINKNTFEFIGFFSTKDLAIKYVIRYLINYYIDNNTKKENINLFIPIDMKYYDFINISINMKDKVYFRKKWNKTNNVNKYLTNDKKLAIKDSFDTLIEIKLNPTIKLIF